MSVESRTLRRSNTVFTRGVDPDNMITVLYSNFLLTPEEKARATQQTLTAHQKLEEIFQAMERRIAVTPGDLHILIQALKAEPAIKAVGDKIQGKGIYHNSYITMSLFLQKLTMRNMGKGRSKTKISNYSCNYFVRYFFRWPLKNKRMGARMFCVYNIHSLRLQLSVSIALERTLNMAGRLARSLLQRRFGSSLQRLPVRLASGEAYVPEKPPVEGELGLSEKVMGWRASPPNPTNV